jgi:hypothetical protein
VRWRDDEVRRELACAALTPRGGSSTKEEFMAKEKETIKLQSIEDLTSAHEWLFNKQRNGEIDSKSADGINTTLKGAVYLRGKLRLDYAKLLLQAKIKKVELPLMLLPELGQLT